MMYDKASLPPPGSPLESIFILVHLERRSAEMLAHRALIQAVLPAEKEAQDPAIKAFEQYCDQVFPFLERAANKDKEDERAALERFAAHPAKIKMQQIYKAQADHAKKIQSLKKFRIKPQSPGQPYDHRKKK